MTGDDKATLGIALVICLVVAMLVGQCLRTAISGKPAYVPANYGTR